MHILIQFGLISVFIFLPRLCETTAAPQRVNVHHKSNIYDERISRQEQPVYPDVVALRQESDDENDPDAVRMRPMQRPNTIRPPWKSEQHLRESPPLHLRPVQLTPINHSFKLSPRSGSSPAGRNGQTSSRAEDKEDLIQNDPHEGDDGVETNVLSPSIDEHNAHSNMHSNIQDENRKDSDDGIPAQDESVMKDKTIDDAEQPNADFDEKQNMTKSSKIDEEEDKLRFQTNKLVKWLRNRLRKRLEDVADLEHEMQTEEIVLRNLNESIAVTATQREDEIRLKLENQKRLKNFQHTISEPNKQIQEAATEKDKLAEQLAQITRTYEALAQVHKDLNSKLLSAGLSHWLETRGKEYMPETAVGVLSKSVDILSPVTNSIEKAYEMDNLFVEEVESVVPVLAKKSILSKVIEDLAMLLPLLPMFVIWYRLVQIFDSLSILHIVFYTSAALLAELLIIVLMSVYVGHEALHVCQTTNELFLSGGLLINFAVILGLLCAQTMICILRPFQSELLQLMLTAVVVQHFWRHVFVPVMVGHSVTTTVAANVGYILVLGFICHHKKEVLDWQTPYDAQIAKAWTAAADWTRETAQAMGNVFHESSSRLRQKGEDVRSVDSASMTDDSSDSEIYTVSSVSQPVGANVPTSPAARNFPPSLFGFARNDNPMRLSSERDDRNELAEPQTRYARWTGVTAWPIRAPARGRQVGWSDDELAQGRISMARSRRFVSTTRFNSNRNGMGNSLR